MRSFLVILLAAATLAAAPAYGQVPRAAHRAPAEAWATVNVCDTTMRPNQIGIRGSMPGLARRSRMYMRFRVQYQTLDGRWRTVKTGADSHWRKVTTARRGEYDAGWTFEFKPPATGGAHVMRGLVTFEWRRAGRVVQKDKAFTEEGHPGTAGADPADFSAETCAIA
jgi:hypothetical protein